MGKPTFQHFEIIPGAHSDAFLSICIRQLENIVAKGEIAHNLSPFATMFSTLFNNLFIELMTIEINLNTYTFITVLQNPE